MFLYRHRSAGLEVAFTDRHGGVSDGPWASLNLGSSNGDEPGRVATNLELVARESGADPTRLAGMRQVHGCDVALVAEEDTSTPVADGLVTSTAGVTLLVRAADCLPVVLTDVPAGVVAVAHAGRLGVVRQVAVATLSAMRRQGATRITAWLGPRICGRCYEVPAPMRSEVSTVVPGTWSQTTWGTPALDLAAGVRAQLEQLDVQVVDIADSLGTSTACTVENHDLFSYRRQGAASGRLGGLVRISGRVTA